MVSVDVKHHVYLLATLLEIHRDLFKGNTSEIDSQRASSGLTKIMILVGLRLGACSMKMSSMSSASHQACWAVLWQGTRTLVSRLHRTPVRFSPKEGGRARGVKGGGG